MVGTKEDANNNESTAFTIDETRTEVRSFQANSLEQLLTGALRSLLVVESGSGIPNALSYKTLRIRGEGKDPGSLLLDLSRSLAEEVETMRLRATEVTIDGLVRSECGIIGWASVTVVELGESLGPVSQVTRIIDQHSERHDHSISIEIGGTG